MGAQLGAQRGVQHPAPSTQHRPAAAWEDGKMAAFGCRRNAKGREDHGHPDRRITEGLRWEATPGSSRSSPPHPGPPAAARPHARAASRSPQEEPPAPAPGARAPAQHRCPGVRGSLPGVGSRDTEGAAALRGLAAPRCRRGGPCAAARPERGGTSPGRPPLGGARGVLSARGGAPLRSAR